MEIIACPNFWGVQTNYDIIKAHGGELEVETIEGEGSEFIIQLNANKSLENKKYKK